MARGWLPVGLLACAGCLFNPGLAQHLLMQADLLLATKNYQGAVGLYDQVIAADPLLREGYLHRGIAYRKLGDFDRARADLDKTAELYPEYAPAFAERARTKLDQLVARVAGDRAQYADAFGPADPLGLNADLDRAATLEQMSGDGTVFLLRGAVRLMQGRDGEAQHDFDRFTRRRPRVKADLEAAVVRWKAECPVIDLAGIDELCKVRPAKG